MRVTEILSKTKSILDVATKNLKFCNCEKLVKTSTCHVTVLGADSSLGEITSYLLKQNPLITTLNIHGGADVIGVAADLNHLDTRCRAIPHAGLDNFCNALKTADIVILLGRNDYCSRMTFGDRVMAEGARICKFAEKCTQYAPKAIIVVCAQPAAVMTPLVAGIFEKTVWYHPARIVGYTCCIPVLVNTAVGRHQGLDPQTVQVPIVGGPDLDCIIPVFSKAIPCPLDIRAGLKLTAELRSLHISDFPQKSKPPGIFFTCSLPEAISINRLITTIAYGIHGDKKAVYCCFIRNSAIKTCKYLVTPVKFSRGGVIHNYGVPKLSKFEQDLLERATTIVAEKEQIAKEYLDYYASKRKDILPAFKQKEVDEFNKRLRCCI